jgi:hypothetical protein
MVATFEQVFKNIPTIPRALWIKVDLVLIHFIKSQILKNLFFSKTNTVFLFFQRQTLLFVQEKSKLPCKYGIIHIQQKI